MLTELFAIPIYINYTTADLTSLEQQIIKLSEGPGVDISNDGGWQSRDHNLKLVNDLVGIHIKKYFRMLGNEHQEYTITSQWANINDPGTANIMHTHGDADFSGIVYINVTEDSGDLFIHNLHAPVKNIIKQFPFAMNAGTGHKIAPENGMVVLFPGNTPHSVLVNRSAENRISVAFNIDII